MIIAKIINSLNLILKIKNKSFEIKSKLLSANYLLYKFFLENYL